MVRTQIQLSPEQAEAVRRRAAERGVSMAEVIRGAIDRELALDRREQLHRRALAAAGRGHDREGRTDVATRHDDYLAEAMEAEAKEKWSRSS